MDIAALSTSLSQMKVAQEASTSVMKMAMDSGQASMEKLTEMLDVNTKIMEQSINPHVGANLDIKL